MIKSSITYTKGKEWWLSRRDEDGREHYPDQIRVGSLEDPRVFVPERTCGVWRGDPSPEHITNWEAHEDDELWCEHCDIELDEDWSYCPYCGSKVVSE